MSPPRDASDDGATARRADVVALRRLTDAIDEAHRSGDRAQLADLLDLLAAQSAEGSPSAVESLLGAVVRFRLAEPAVRRVLLDPHDVDDAVQATLLKVSQHIGTYRRDARFTTWLHTVAHNEARMLVRGRSREQSRDGRANRQVAGADRRMSSLVVEREALRAIVDTLPPHHRDVLLLREWEGREYDEIAAELGVPIGTVRSRLSRAREELDRRVVVALRTSNPTAQS